MEFIPRNSDGGVPDSMPVTRSGNRIQVGEMRLFGADLPPPVLSIHASGNNVLVSWPNVSGFGLESKSALTNATWTPVGVAPVRGNGVNTVTLPTRNRQWVEIDPVIEFRSW